MSDIFIISDLQLGRGRLGISPLPGRYGKFDEDLTQLLCWKPALVMSMTEDTEMTACGAGNVGQRLKDAGILWHHLPIRDFGAPEAHIRALWPNASAQAIQALNAGGNVLIHCRGGCGRSGMAALRLMVEMGEPAISALNRLRAARPCAVETEAQELWATLDKI